MDETKQVGDIFALVLGLGIVSTDAFNAGSGSLPDPSAEPEYPWLWWDEIRLEAFVAAGEEALGSTHQRIVLDTKAMRKISPGQTLVLVGQITTATGAPVTALDVGGIRVLFGT